MATENPPGAAAPRQEAHERRRDVPDPSESRERAHPKREPGLGEVDPPHRVKDNRDGNPKDSTHNRDKHGAPAGEDQREGGDAVDPADPEAHGDRSDPARPDPARGAD